MPYSDDELRRRIENLERIVIAMASGGGFAMTTDDAGRPAIVATEPFAGLPAQHQSRTLYVPPPFVK